MVDKIKIGDKDYRVLECENILYDSGHIGQIDYRKSQILVSAKQEEQEWRNTLVHEAVHGMLRFMGESGRNRDEESVERIANGLLMLVKDNPKLFGLK